MSQSSHVCLPLFVFYLLFCCFLYFVCFHPSAPERRCVASSASAVLESAAGLSQFNISFQLVSPLCFLRYGSLNIKVPPSQNFTHYLSFWDYSITNVLVFLSAVSYRITFILLFFFVLPDVGGFCFSSFFCCFSAMFKSSLPQQHPLG